MQKTFSIRESLSFAFNTVKGRLPFFVGIILIPMIIGWVFQFLSTMLSTLGENLSQSDSVLANLSPMLSFGSIAVSIASMVISILMSLGSTKILLAVVDGGTPELKELFSERALVVRAFMAMLISGILITCGFIALVIPGVILAILYQFFMYIVVDTGFGGFTALKESARVTKGVRLKLVLLSLTMVGVNLIGFALVGIGIFFTIPITTLAHAYVYRTLKSQTV